MHITSKSRYALKMLMDFASFPEGALLKRREISARTQIPQKYMDKILANLKSAGMIQSVRGRDGGLHLAKPSSSITVWDILCSAEEIVSPVKCLDNSGGCTIIPFCQTKDAWETIVGAMRDSLQAITLADLSSKTQGLPKWPLTNTIGLTECRGPEKLARGHSTDVSPLK